MRNKTASKGTLRRLMKMLFAFYPAAMPFVVVCIVFSAAVSSIPAVFMQRIIAVVETTWQSGDWSAAAGPILSSVGLLAVFYVLSLLSAFVFSRMMAVITQGFLKKMRVFDTHNHGDVMSYYTNDIDTLRQMISQSFPQLLISAVTVLTIFSIMLYYSVWLTLVVVAGVVFMLFVTKKVGGNSARYFIRQQVSMGEVEGFVEEMMNGQKVVKVFCHEKDSIAAFDRVND